MSEITKSKRDIVLDQIMTDLKTDLSNLDSVWITQPALIVKYAAKLAEAERVCSDEKDRVDSLNAAIYNIVRSARSMNGTKSSESAIEAMVKQIERHFSGLDPDLNLNITFIQELPEKTEVIARALSAARRNLIQSREMADLYKGALEGLRHRRDMVVQASKKAILDYEILGAGTFSGKSNSR